MATLENPKKLPIQEKIGHFLKSPEGKKMQEIRYARYKGSIPSKEWEQLLGSDATHASHMWFSLQIMKSFVADLDIPKADKDILLTVAVVHAWVKGVLGDCMVDKKTASYIDEEKTKLTELLEKYFHTNTKNKIISVIYGDESKNEKTKIFHLVERIGYMRVALHIWKQSLSKPEGVQTRLHWLVSNVIGNQFAQLLQDAKEYPKVLAYLTQEISTIDEIFKTLDIEKVIRRYPTTERDMQHQKFENARDSWEEVISSSRSLEDIKHTLSLLQELLEEIEKISVSVDMKDTGDIRFKKNSIPLYAKVGGLKRVIQQEVNEILRWMTDHAEEEETPEIKRDLITYLKSVHDAGYLDYAELINQLEGKSTDTIIIIPPFV